VPLSVLLVVDSVCHCCLSVVGDFFFDRFGYFVLHVVKLDLYSLYT